MPDKDKEEKCWVFRFLKYALPVHTLAREPYSLMKILSGRCIAIRVMKGYNGISLDIPDEMHGQKVMEEEITIV
jgi:hypothetical protein